MSSPGMTVLWSGILNCTFSNPALGRALLKYIVWVSFNIHWFKQLPEHWICEAPPSALGFMFSCYACLWNMFWPFWSVNYQVDITSSNVTLNCVWPGSICGGHFPIWISRNDFILYTTFRPWAKSFASCFICIIHDSLLLDSSYNRVILPLISCLFYYKTSLT